MEIAHQKNLLPAETHANYRLWLNYAEFAADRGKMVCNILESFGPISGLNFLDVGCGEGGTSFALAQREAKVWAIDFNPVRVQKLRDILKREEINVTLQTGDAQNLAFENNQFDGVVLQDVIEHLHQPHRAVQEIFRVLKPGGILYLSTPNRWSPFNLILDPHWNLPLVAILPRGGVNYFITKIAKREKFIRKDFAALLSLRQLRQYFRKSGLTLEMVNKRIANELFINPKAVINSEFHLKAIKIIKKAGLKTFFKSLVNDKLGIFNYMINPTWYIVARKQ